MRLRKSGGPTVRPRHVECPWRAAPRATLAPYLVRTSPVPAFSCSLVSVRP